MISTKLIVLLILMLVVGLTTFAASDLWASRLQRLYIAQAKELHVNHTRWEHPYVKNLFKAGIVCAAVLTSALLFSSMFGPISL